MFPFYLSLVLASKVGPSANLLQDSFDDFYQWDQIGRPALTEIRVRPTTHVLAIQAIYGSYALTGTLEFV